MNESFIKFLGDISGTPKTDNKGNYQNVIIGVVTVNKYTLKKDLSIIQQNFPDYWDKKGHQLYPNELEKIVNFLNQLNMKMITVQFKPSDWNKYRKKYPNESHIEEKIMSILYFYVLKHIARKNCNYDVMLDFDSNFKIKQCIGICQRLSREQYFDFDISFGYRDLNSELRLPDWIAQSRRKIDEKILSKYQNFYILKNKLAFIYLLKVFKSITF